MISTLRAELLRERSLADRLWVGGLALGVALLLWQLPFFLRGGLSQLFTLVWHHAYVIVWMLVVTALGRTLPLRILAAGFLTGMYVAMALALGIGFPLSGLFGRDNRLFDSFLVPLLEESAKALPVLLFFWYVTRHKTWRPSMTDGLLLGYVSGTGFGIHEDVMYGRVWGGGFGVSEWSIFLPTIADFRVLGVGRAFGVYHAETTAIIGLAIGAGFLLRERLRWWWAIPAVAFALGVLDHASFNYMVSEGGGGASATIRRLVLDGRLAVYLLLGGTAAAVIAEVLILRSMAARDTLYRAIPLATQIGWLRSGGRAGLARVQAARAYNRTRRSVHYALWAARPTASDRAWVARLGVALLGVGERAGLTFGAPGTTAEEP